jgi:hypothetical protein
MILLTSWQHLAKGMNKWWIITVVYPNQRINYLQFGFAFNVVFASTAATMIFVRLSLLLLLMLFSNGRMVLELLPDSHQLHQYHRHKREFVFVGFEVATGR